MVNQDWNTINLTKMYNIQYLGQIFSSIATKLLPKKKKKTLVQPAALVLCASQTEPTNKNLPCDKFYFIIQNNISSFKFIFTI